MDFPHVDRASEQPRRRRRNIAKRRLRNRAPISARLALDSQLRGSIGIVSEDLANDLFQPPSVTGE
jgi:peroxin-6